MGCTTSKSKAPVLLDTSSQGTDAIMTDYISNKSYGSNTPLSENQILSRIEASNEVEYFKLPGGVNVAIAFVCQRGYYPDDLDKDNQDAFLLDSSFGTEGDMSFFGVFDGHGKEGHLCARYARDTLPKTILRRLTQTRPDTFKAMRMALTLAHLETNEMLHHDPKIDDLLSGTTSVTALVKGKTMYLSNVGDSRAIIVSKHDSGRLVASSLTSDQTPYRKDERERVKKTGARVLSMDQIEGLRPLHENWGDVLLGDEIDEGGDPPRVWHPKESWPGTAFTRSLGDKIAKSLGVTAEPEVHERELTEADKYVIIASDGVFEFLTNQMVADIVVRHDDPLHACKAVVSAAYDLWLQYEVRTDDITILLISIESFDKTKSSPETLQQTHAPSPTVDLTRPVKRTISRVVRKNMILNSSVQQEEEVYDTDFQSSIVEKSPIEVKSITSAIKSNFLFQHLNSVQRDLVINLMQPVTVAAGDWIIKQGDDGDKFYVVESGRYEVRVLMPGSDASVGGNVVHTYESDDDQHPGFGELSLMYNKPRAASVIAISDGKLWSLNRKFFKSVVMKSSFGRKDIIKTLRKVELLQCLNVHQVQRLADLMCDEHFSEGDYIIRQGEKGESFYLIVSGQCDVTISSTSEGVVTEKVVAKLKDFNFFGERALLTSEPRAANIVARSNCRLLSISKTSFVEVLGDLNDLLAEKRLQDEQWNELILKAACAEDSTDLALNFHALISSDSASMLTLGSFAAATTEARYGIRSFIQSEVYRLNLQGSVLAFVEALKLVSTRADLCFVPTLRCIEQVRNAIHLVFNCSIVADLSSLLRSSNSDGSIQCGPETVVYVAACVASAIQLIHDASIVYRAVQPESLCVDLEGKVIFMDYRVCKVAAVGTRTYTICGASDYLSPEQISQRGHGEAVDFWAMGLLLFELSTGSNPFSTTSEVATYAKITSFGTKGFQELPFPDDILPDLRSLINRLLMPAPEARLGVGQGGISNLIKHAAFDSIDWQSLDRLRSPMYDLAHFEYGDLVGETLSNAHIERFDDDIDPSWLLDVENK